MVLALVSVTEWIRVAVESDGAAAHEGCVERGFGATTGRAIAHRATGGFILPVRRNKKALNCTRSGRLTARNKNATACVSKHAMARMNRFFHYPETGPGPGSKTKPKRPHCPKTLTSSEQ